MGTKGATRAHHVLLFLWLIVESAHFQPSSGPECQLTMSGAASTPASPSISSSPVLLVSHAGVLLGSLQFLPPDVKAKGQSLQYSVPDAAGSSPQAQRQAALMVRCLRGKSLMESFSEHVQATSA